MAFFHERQSPSNPLSHKGSHSTRLLMSYSDNIPRKQAARIVGVSESTIFRLGKTDNFPRSSRIGGRTFYSEEEIRVWIEQKKQDRIDP